MRKNIGFDFPSGFFSSIIKQGKSNIPENSYFSIGDLSYSKFSSSGSHFCFLTRGGHIRGFGNNNQKQLCDLPKNQISIPVSLEFQEERFTEIACGNGFTVAISDTRKVCIRGSTYGKSVFSDYLAPRGLSAMNNAFSFAYEVGKVALFMDKDVKTVDLAVPIISTAITNNSLAVLTMKGDVFVSKLGGKLEMIKVKGIFDIDWISGSSNSIICCSKSSL